jgi:hypothetical protein
MYRLYNYMYIVQSDVEGKGSQWMYRILNYMYRLCKQPASRVRRADASPPMDCQEPQ